MDSLAKCFNGLQERYENVQDAKPIFRDELDITLPLDKSEASIVEPTKKSRCLQRAKRIEKSLRFEEEEEMIKPLAQKEGLKPHKVVRFQLENNKIFEPKKDVKYDYLDDDDDGGDDDEEKPLKEKEGLNKVVKVKIKMTKQEARRLLLKCKNDNVLDFEHVVDQIVHVPVHQLQVSVVVVDCNNKRQGNSGCLLSQLE